MLGRAHRFHLAVDLATLVAVATLFLVTRNPWGAQAGFAVLSLHAIPSMRRSSKEREDERDMAHRLTAARAGMATWWVLFVLVATAILLRYGTDPVPSWILGWSVWAGWLVQSLVGTSVALVLDRRA